MFGGSKKKRRKKKTSYEGKKIQSFTELSIGDYVVHEDMDWAFTEASRRSSRIR